jgi:rSAM/selenodomain-associated transferase 1
MPIRANALVVMAKAPVPGTVKTRLVPPFSFEEAAELYRCLLLDQIDNLNSFRDADLFLAFSPDEAASFFKEIVPAGFACFPQRGEDLGERMNHAFIELSNKGYKHIAIIGGDLPAFPQRFLEEAFVRLERSETDVVLGPSRDGGYYLIGMNRPIPEIFEEITWGSDSVLSSTIQKLSKLGLKPHLLPLWFDIDTPEDLRYLESVSNRFSACSQQRTLRLLKKLTSATKANSSKAGAPHR